MKKEGDVEMDKQAPLTDNAEPSTPRWARKPFVSGHGRAMVAIGFLALSIVVSLLTITIVHDYFFIGVSPITIGGGELPSLVPPRLPKPSSNRGRGSESLTWIGGSLVVRAPRPVLEAFEGSH
ncbi:MAG: hypothetical protein E6I75_20765 [Chloroflexi bacterium]|nr:MAG: hypothetical protein E6I75_20765 [Chloroflexota bacterium]